MVGKELKHLKRQMIKLQRTLIINTTLLFLGNIVIIIFIVIVLSVNRPLN